jgi:hypothetical protein
MDGQSNCHPFLHSLINGVQSRFSLSYKFYLMNIVAVESVITIEPS